MIYNICGQKDCQQTLMTMPDDNDDNDNLQQTMHNL